MQPDPKPKLSPQETRVLDLLAWGYIYAEISEEMCVRRDYVKDLAYSARDKLGARTMFEAAVIATHQGIIGEETPPTAGISGG